MKEIWEGLKVLGFIALIVVVGVGAEFIPLWILWPLGHKDLGMWISCGVAVTFFILWFAHLIGEGETRGKR